MMIFWSFEVKLFVYHCLGAINKGTIQQTHPPCSAWPLITHSHNWFVAAKRS